MTNRNSDQEKLCPNFNIHMENMEQNLQELVRDPTQKRLKIIIMATKDALEKFFTMFDINDDGLHYYKIPQKLYNSYEAHVYAVVKKKCIKGVNFGRVKKKMDKAKVWGLFKGYWFHNAPKEMTQTLWIPLLKSIAKYFRDIGKLYATEHWSQSQIEKFLKLLFVKNLLEVKCQINSQSNPGGPVIQFAAWKIESMQHVLNNYFNRAYLMKWDAWLQKKYCNGKKWRINAIIQQLVKPFAQKQFKDWVISTGMDMEFIEFSVDVEVIQRMDLSQHFREEDDDEKSHSDQSSLSTINNTYVEDNNGVEIIPPPNTNHDGFTMTNYNGYRGGTNTLSNYEPEYRYHPYNTDSKELMHIKCEYCNKCKHHCKCDDVAAIIQSQEAMVPQHNVAPFPYYQSYAVEPYSYYNDISGCHYQNAPPMNINYNFYNNNNSTHVNMDMEVETMQNDSIMPAVTNDFFTIPNNTLLTSSDRDISSFIGTQDGNDGNNDNIFY